METTIMSYPLKGEELIAKCGIATTTNTPPSEYKVKKKEIGDFIKVGRSMELSSVFDFPQIIYEVKGVSRSFTHQHVRHRMAAHMQQSLRYAEISPTLDGEETFFVTPPSIVEEGKESIIEYINNQLGCAKEYLNKLENDVPAEDARFFLPIGTRTFLTTAMNVESLLHYFNVRACFDSQWEIRSNAYALIAGCKLIYPNIFNECGPHCINNKCRGRGNGECKPKAQRLLNKIEKKIDSRRKKFEELNKGDKLTIDLTDLIGFQANDELEKKVGKEFDQQKIDLSRKVKVSIVKN
ncbi:FAD-dependent thymidylate synthase [archaeon SCG-AAA382B04]|nr:FAD-dependent thymidylate synthase [archaeon SCG-AAA382B04]